MMATSTALVYLNNIETQWRFDLKSLSVIIKPNLKSCLLLLVRPNDYIHDW